MSETSLGDALSKALAKIAERIRDRAIDEAPYVKGVLRRSITVHDENPLSVIVSAVKISENGVGPRELIDLTEDVLSGDF